MQNIFTSKRAFLFGLIIIASIVVILAFFTTFFQNQNDNFVYVENEKIYSSSKVVADNVSRIVDRNEASSQILYLTKAAVENVGGHPQGSDLVVKDSVTGKEKVIAKKVVDAKFSPDGTRVVVQNEDHEVRLLTLNREEVARIGAHGSAPFFSHDGKYIAYHKLADQGTGFRLYEFSPYGLALYNPATGKEELITDNKDDFQPVGFSADMSKLYFNSGRKYDTSPEGFENHVASLWVVDLKTKAVTRLTNTDEEVVRQGTMVPTVNSMALWSSDRKTIISENDGKVWQFSLDEGGGLKGAKYLADGTSPNWLVPDQSIVVRTTVEGKGEWKTINIK